PGKACNRGGRGEQIGRNLPVPQQSLEVLLGSVHADISLSLFTGSAVVMATSGVGSAALCLQGFHLAVAVWPGEDARRSIELSLQRSADPTIHFLTVPTFRGRECPHHT